MTQRSKISLATQSSVRKRAQGLCEYCHTIEKWQLVPFTIDHVIPLSKGGTNNASNLSLACFHCNRYKSNLTEVLDTATSTLVPLFNPRLQQWQDHFIWAEDKLYILGLTAVGKVTIEQLRLNRERIIRIRAADLQINRHPPVGDPVTAHSP